MLGSMLYQPQPIIVGMEMWIPVGQTIDIGGKSYNQIVALTNYVPPAPHEPPSIAITYNVGQYLLQNPYPKDLPTTEPKPTLRYNKEPYNKFIYYLLLINVKNIKLKVKVTAPPETPSVSLYAGDTKVDIKQFDVWQDISIEFNTRKNMTTLYIDVTDKEHAPTTYMIGAEIDAWEFTS